MQDIRKIFIISADGYLGFCQMSMMVFFLEIVNLFMPGGNIKVTHT